MTEISQLGVEDILAVHEAIIAEDPNAEPGVRNRDAIESALAYVLEGFFGQVPETVHEKAAHLMRLLVSEHPFVDGNKRTALNTVAVFYALDEQYFAYDESVEDILIDFATDADAVEIETVVDTFEHAARPLDDIDDQEIRAEVERLRSVVR